MRVMSLVVSRSDKRSVIRHGLASSHREAIRLRFANLTYEHFILSEHESPCTIPADSTINRYRVVEADA